MLIDGQADILNPETESLRPGGLGAVGLTAAQQAYYDFLVSIPGEGPPAEVYAYVQALTDTQALASLAVRLGRSIYPDEASARQAGYGEDGLPGYVVADYLKSIFPQLQIEAQQAAAKNVAFYQREQAYQDELRRIQTGESVTQQAVEPFKLAQPELAMFFDVPTNLPERTPDEKAQFYLARSIEGFSDAQIRQTIEAVFGAQPDTDWAALRALVAPMVSKVPYMGAGTIITPDIAAAQASKAAKEAAAAESAAREAAAREAAAAAKAAADAAARAAADAAAKNAADAAAKAADAAAAKAAADAAAKAAADAAAKAAADAAAKAGAQAGLGPLLLAVAAAAILGG